MQEFASAADREYANGAFIPGAAGLAAQWPVRAAAFRAAQGPARARLDLPYGPGARQRFDLFLPAAAPLGLMVFVHGGYWIEGGREGWSHLAAGAVARGWAVALPSYTLAPAAPIAAMTQEIAAAVRAAGDLVPGPVVVTGHSAGGHLAARMACADIGLPRLVRVVPISPLAELAPLRETAMNADLRLSPADCRMESPARLVRRAGVACHVWVGAQERPAFLWQARSLSEAWACPWTPEPGRHHFDVMEGLAVPQSALMRACLDGA